MTIIDEVGQMYGPHYDYIPAENPAVSGPRVLTFFLCNSHSIDL